MRRKYLRFEQMEVFRPPAWNNQGPLMAKCKVQPTDVPCEGEWVRPPRPFDFSRVNPRPSRGDIKAACLYWLQECRLLGLETPDREPPRRKQVWTW
jgi:hypothetical protein